VDFCRRAAYAMPSLCLRRFAAVIALLVVPMFFNFPAVTGFSCTAPATARERLICGDPKLLRADRALALDLRTTIGAVSKSGREALRDEQREWLSYIESICAVGRNASHERSNALCLEDEYAKRQRQLKSAVVRSRGMVIRRVDLFKVTPSSGNNPKVKFNVTSSPSRKSTNRATNGRRLGTALLPNAVAATRPRRPAHRRTPRITTSMSITCLALSRRP
jgi:uncharacterized protein